MARAADPQEVLCTLPEVQLHQISGGQDQLLVTAPLTVNVVQSSAGPEVDIQVAQHKWRLDPALPALKSTDSAFMFAMPNSTFYCILIPQGTPDQDIALFEVLLEETTSYQPQPELSIKDREELVSEVSGDLMQPGAIDPNVADEGLLVPAGADGGSPHMMRIASGSAKLQGKIAQGADWASRKMMEASERLQARSDPRAEPLQISEGTQRNIQRARTVAAHGAAGAGAVANKLTDISTRVADSLIRRLGRSQTSEQLADPNASPQKKQSAIRDVAAASVLAALEVYDSMEAAALVVTKASGDATSGYVSHKYGQQAGQAARDLSAAGYSTVSTVRSVSQIRRMGATAVARRVARRTAKGIAKSWVMPNQVAGSQAKPALGAASGSSGPAAVTQGASHV